MALVDDFIEGDGVPAEEVFDAIRLTNPDAAGLVAEAMEAL